MWVLWIPMPQKMAKASTKFSSFLVNIYLRHSRTTKEEEKKEFEWWARRCREGNTHQLIKFINQLNDANNLTQWVFNSHAQYWLMLKRRIFVDARIKTGIIICVRDVNGLMGDKSRMIIISFMNMTSCDVFKLPPRSLQHAPWCRYWSGTAIQTD